MPPTEAFPQFPRLPGEIRMLIWEFHFSASPRIHVVHERGPRPTTPVPRPGEALALQCTTLDAGTNIVIPGFLRSDVNHEAWTVAKGLVNTRGAATAAVSPLTPWPPPPPPPGGPRVCLASELMQSRTISSVFAWTGMSRSAAPGAAPGTRADADPSSKVPVSVDWDGDLIFICSTSSEQCFRNLEEQPWADRIRRLAVLVPTRSEADIPFGPSNMVSQTLRPMAALRSLYVVMIPPPAPAGRLRHLARDRFGFAAYVDYLKATGVTTQEMIRGRHLAYQRTALSFGEALLRHLGRPEVKLRKVMDVDCSAFTESEYRRREKWRAFGRGEEV